jgi:oligopeptidase A
MKDTVVQNPLLDFSALPRFGDIQPYHVGPALEELLGWHRAKLEQLLTAARHYTWDNFAQPLEDSNEMLARMWSTVSHLNAVVNSETLRAAYNEGLPKISEFYTELAQNERVYGAYKEIAGNRDFSALTPAQRKIIENNLRDFRLAGAELHGDAKRRFKEIESELATLTNRYAENVLDATQAWHLNVVDANELAGLPESARAVAVQTAERAGQSGWRLTLDFPCYIAVMTYADNRSLRQRLYEAYVTRASDQGPHAGQWDNSEIMLRILRLRREKARLLGFANYAEYALQTRMARRVDEVLKFLGELAARSRPVAQREIDELRAFARADHGIDELEAWDIAYYAEKLRQARYSFSQEDIRPYFPEARVVGGLFKVAESLYGMRVEPLNGVETWHPDVRAFEIRASTGERRGQFYMDLYARANKQGGAWMDECMGRKRRESDIQIPVAYLVCNFAPPVDGQPALLTHDEVTTLFHEFGHCLHHLLTQVDELGVAGINGVAWDAVELPSQIMENWCWERDALDRVSGHYQSGDAVPRALFEKMIAAKNFHTGMQFVRQLEFAVFDFRLYSDFDPDSDSTIRQLLDDVRRDVAVVIPPAYNRFQNGFTHIFSGGYAAGYYSYKWAEVLSADAFGKFEENGVFDQRTGTEFLQNVLERGGVREPMDMFISFRGRKPNIDALLRHSGLAS